MEESIFPLSEERATKLKFKIQQWKKSPMLFIKDMWGLEPQPFKNEECDKMAWEMWYKEWTVDLFADPETRHYEMWEIEFDYEVYRWKFELWKHYSWQQYQVLLALQEIVTWYYDHDEDVRNKISIASWRWVWKSRLLSYIIIWFLFCFKEAVVPCTSPTKDQMFDALWKEVHNNIYIMPDDIKQFFIPLKDTIKIRRVDGTESKLAQARAKTSRDWNYEALSWVHGENALVIVDEASAVEDRVLETWLWALTWTKWLMIVFLISNPTKVEWFFYRSHNDRFDSELYHRFIFNGEESPLVWDWKKWHRLDLLAKSWWDRDQLTYKTDVRWLFPEVNDMDTSGWMPLIEERHLIFHSWEDNDFGSDSYIWVDPAWIWRNKTVMVIRNKFKAKIIFEEQISTPLSVAEAVMTAMKRYNIKEDRVFVDAFWEWSRTITELAMCGIRVNQVFSWKEAQEPNGYTNIRSEIYWRTQQWLRNWWRLIDSARKFKEIVKIKFMMKWSKIAIMSKVDMKKKWIPSPDYADALSYTFTKERVMLNREEIISWDSITAEELNRESFNKCLRMFW